MALYHYFSTKADTLLPDLWGPLVKQCHRHIHWIPDVLVQYMWYPRIIASMLSMSTSAITILGHCHGLSNVLIHTTRLLLALDTCLHMHCRDLVQSARFLHLEKVALYDISTRWLCANLL